MIFRRLIQKPKQKKIKKISREHEMKAKLKKLHNWSLKISPKPKNKNFFPVKKYRFQKSKFFVYFGFSRFWFWLHEPIFLAF
jgi:hypothetical protein